MFIPFEPCTLPFEEGPEPPEDPAGGCPCDVVVGEGVVEAPVMDAMDIAAEEAGPTPFDTPVDMEAPPPPPPPIDVAPDAPLEAGALVAATAELVELGGAVYTVVASAGRLAAAPPPPPAIVVVPVTWLSS